MAMPDTDQFRFITRIHERHEYHERCPIYFTKNYHIKIVLDFKAKQAITKEDYMQIKRYLSVSELKLGIIVNFRQPFLYPKRVAN